MLQSRDSVPGIPVDVLKSEVIHVQLSHDLMSGIEGRSDSSTRRVYLPAAEASRWNDDKLRSVIAHELAHIALRSYLETAQLAAWFDEGFAEWASGGPTCQGWARIRSDLLDRERDARAPPSLLDLKRSRLSYDYFGSFFEFLDDEARDSVGSGALTKAVRHAGVGEGFRILFGMPFDRLEELWRLSLRERADQCAPAGGDSWRQDVTTR